MPGFWNYLEYPVLFLHLRHAGPMRLGGIFKYVPIRPAPESYSYAGRIWYYLAHRQCFNQFLGILGLLACAMGELWMNRRSGFGLARTVFHELERWSWRKLLPPVLLTSYLTSGLLTAWHAVHSKEN
jgi:hypothetical protein